MKTEELRAALEALPVDERKKIAAAVLGGTYDPATFDKAAHAREIGKLGGRPKGKPLSEEHKKRISETRLAKYGAPKSETTETKRKAGRPRKEQPPIASARPVGRPPKEQPETTEPKRGRGRPKKSETAPTGQTAVEAP